MKYKLENNIITLETTDRRECFLLGEIAQIIKSRKGLAPKAESWFSICNGGTAHITITTTALTDILLSTLL